MNIQEKFEGLANLGAGWIMWLLVGLSVLSVALIIERAILFLTTSDDVQKLRADLRALYRAGKYADAKARLAQSKSFEARVAENALDELSRGPEAVEERVMTEVIDVRMTMDRNLAFLGTVGNNAPFVGLLGTVIGIVRAFRQLKMSQGGQVSDSLLAEIGEALVATAIGLLVALPAVAFFNLFNRAIRARIERAKILGGDILVEAKATTGQSPSKEG